MKTGSSLLLAVLCCAQILLVLPSGMLHAGWIVRQEWEADELFGDRELDAFRGEHYTTAQADTYCLVWYDFEMLNWQGWTSRDNTAPPDSFGAFAGLASNLYDKDPCNADFGTQVVFYVGSTEQSSEYPGLFNTPIASTVNLMLEHGHDEMIVSPAMDMRRYSTGKNENQDAEIPSNELPGLGGARLRFTVYRDLPLDNLVFYNWRIRTWDAAGGWSSWYDRGFAYYGGKKDMSGTFVSSERDYFFADHDVSDLVGADSVQIALGVVDLYHEFYGYYGSGSEHRPAPWFDDVRLYRYEHAGPVWSYRDVDLFQDTFPSVAFDLESYCRADMAADVSPLGNRFIVPGDWIVVGCAAPSGGRLDTLWTGDDRVYCHVNVEFLGPDDPPKPDLYGPDIAGDYGTYRQDDGNWTILLCSQALDDVGDPVENKYVVDLNDSLFTRGYMIEYYFKAFDRNGNSSTLPAWAEEGRQSRHRGGSALFEFTCLPTLASDILYVDHFHGRGTWDGAVQTYLDETFAAVIPRENTPDRYDVMGPSSLVSNSLGSRASLTHLTTAYEVIIWDSGNLRRNTIADTTTTGGDKSNDCQRLIDWLSLSEHDCNLLLMGDNIGWELDRIGDAGSASAQLLLGYYCGAALYPYAPDGDSYFEMTGEVNPMLSGVPGSPFAYEGHTYDYYLYGGCGIVNAFDVFLTEGTGQEAALYSEFPDLRLGAVYNILTVNSCYSRIVLLGHSFMNIRDIDGSNSPMTRNEILRAILNWFQSDTNPDITGADTPSPFSYGLAQSYPNPFNPAATIRYSIAEEGRVTIRIYDAAGRHVRMLVDDVRKAGEHTAVWDGRNNSGAAAASGVYFYRMESNGFVDTRKMVLLR
ncbi:MAG: FlgD immunoglobulin-like domain containing protein [Candidatus Krumholzibacteria bacterium]|nr:FlgD immunoglobulin-like domain containing protein [Candidatus Krumholzibacteria bacterium]